MSVPPQDIGKHNDSAQLQVHNPVTGKSYLLLSALNGSVSSPGFYPVVNDPTTCQAFKVAGKLIYQYNDAELPVNAPWMGSYLLLAPKQIDSTNNFITLYSAGAAAANAAPEPAQVFAPMMSLKMVVPQTPGGYLIYHTYNTTGNRKVYESFKSGYQVPSNYMPVDLSTGSFFTAPDNSTSYYVTPSALYKIKENLSWSPLKLLSNVYDNMIKSKTTFDSLIINADNSKIEDLTKSFSGDDYMISKNAIIVPTGWLLYRIKDTNSAGVTTYNYISVPSDFNISTVDESAKLFPINEYDMYAKLPSYADEYTRSDISIAISDGLVLVAKIAAVVGAGGLAYVSVLIITNPDKAKRYLSRFYEFRDMIVTGAVLAVAFAIIGLSSFIAYEFYAAYQQTGTIGGALGLLTAKTLEELVKILVEVLEVSIREIGDFIDTEVSSFTRALADAL